MRSMTIKSLRFLILITFFLLSLFMIRNEVRANGLFEVSTGLTQATGSDLESSTHLGIQTSMGWGGRPSFMGKGGALYVLGSLRRETLNQEGPVYYGSPQIDRRQWTPSLSARLYHLLNEQLRFSMDLGLGYTFEQSAVKIITTPSFSGTSSALVVGAGLQYKLRAGLLLSASFEQLWYLNSKALSYPERPFLNSQDSSMTGRSRFSLGIGFYL